MTEDVSTTAIPSRNQALLVLICTSVPSFMIQFDANIVSVSLPAIAHSLGASFAGIEWVVTAYILSFASLLLPAGALADWFGRKTTLVIGLSLFTVASVLCGSAPSLSVLIAARALQGAGAALQLSSALASLSHSFQGAARARAFSFWGSVVGIGMVTGPVAGGLITEAFGWEWAFWINLPIGVALLALIARTLENSKDPSAVRLDLPGVFCFGSALFLSTLALIEGNHRGWTDRYILSELAGAFALFVVFVVVELRQTRPMLDLAYFLKPTYIGANIAQGSFAAGLLSMLTFIPVFLQNGLGNGSAVAGLMMLPMVIPPFLVPRMVTKHLAHRFSGRALLTMGLLLSCCGFLLMAAFVRDRAYLPLIGGMFVAGVGIAFLNGETTKVGMTVIPKERSGMASGVQGTVRFSGLVIGIAVLGAILFGKVAAAIADALPNLADADRLRLVRNITAGDLSGSGLSGIDMATLHELSLNALAKSYQAIFLAAGILLFLASTLTWRLVSAAETPPVPPSQPRSRTTSS
jgi:EmrB/QacA subfamily drug resistance transporter